MKDWEDFRYALALARFGSMVAAASSLGVTAATVSRHIDRLSEAVGTQMFEFRDGRWQVSDTGMIVVRAAERIEAEVAAAQTQTQDNEDVSGKVVVNTVSFVNSFFLAPNLNTLCADNPALLPVIDATERNVSLANGEADVGIRLLRPETGRLVRRPISQFPIGLFGPSAADDANWVGLPEWLDWLPEMEAALDYFGRAPAIRVDSFPVLPKLPCLRELSGLCRPASPIRLTDLSVITPGRFKLNAWAGAFITRTIAAMQRSGRSPIGSARCFPKVDAPAGLAR